MSPRKLSDSDRQEILELYRQTEETTSSLANRFGVSSSTISRFLKSSLSQSEYEDLIQVKRLARTGSNEGEKYSLTQSTQSQEKSETVKQLELNVEENFEKITLGTYTEVEEFEGEFLEEYEQEVNERITVTDDVAIEDSNPDLELEEELEEESLESVQGVAAMFGEYLDEDEDDEDDEDEDDEDDDDEDELLEDALSLEKQLQVLSLKEANFPLVCYLVIDRHSELVTKPMKDFAHLGNIPSGESLQKTLPIFDNHKVAKRFCVRKGKVIKVPDGKVFQKTSSYLKAKGISRILMDGKVYAIAD